jgi:endonuclease/exonuclease/phosphatase family metal-dependent hydrolase
VGSESISMGSTVYVGLAVSSHVAGVLADAAFSSTTVSATATTTTTPTTTTATSSTSKTLRLLHWNVHHGGIGTDGVYNPDRIADWVTTMNPDLVSMNEVDTQGQVDAIVSALKTKTGIAWYVSFSGLGNLMISKLPLNAASKCLYSTTSNYAPNVSVTVNGRTVNVWSAHLSVSSAIDRLYQTKALQTCASGWSEARIIAGDYNMQEGSTEYNQAIVGYSDAWKVATALGTTLNYSGNCDGCTRNSRIDYVFTSQGATYVTLKSAQIVDTRDASGYMPSDHKPMLVVYNVN